MTEDELEMLADEEYHAWVDGNLEEARRAMDETPYLFVYGTLRPDDYNAHLLADSRHLGNAETVSTCYKMVSLGAFPAAVEVEGDNAASIVGSLFLVDPETLRRIDHLESEGEFYLRKLATVVDEAGDEVCAWMYVIQDESWLRFRETDDSRVFSYVRNGQIYHFWKNLSCLV